MRIIGRPGLVGLVIDLLHVSSLDKSSKPTDKQSENTPEAGGGPSSSLERFGDHTLNQADEVYFDRHGRYPQGQEFERSEYLSIARGVEAGYLRPRPPSDTLPRPASARPAMSGNSPVYSRYSYVGTTRARPGADIPRLLCRLPLLVVCAVLRLPYLLARSLYKSMSAPARARRRAAADARRAEWARQAKEAVTYRYDRLAAVAAVRLAAINGKIELTRARKQQLELKLQRVRATRRARTQAAIAKLAQREERLAGIRHVIETQQQKREAERQARLARITLRSKPRR